MKKEMNTKLLFADAAAVWHMKDLNDSTGRNNSFVVNGNVKVGVQLTELECEASLKRGGDGYAALFEGQGWLSTDNEPQDFLGLSREEMTLCIRICATKPGGLVHTNLFSLVIHGDGLVIGLLGVEVGQSRMYRDIPLSMVKLNEWHDLIVRYKTGNLEFFSDGVLMNDVLITEQPRPIFTGPCIAGGWRIENPPLPDFPKEIIDSIFQRLFTGSIDHVAFWSRAITDSEVALLSGVESAGKPVEKSDRHKCLNNYRLFHEASRANNVKACEKLGLSIRKFMAQDPQKPIYHLTAPMAWISDPAGAFYYEGKYHVFSYRNIFSLLACTPLAHYVSDDMIHWKDMPIAVWADSDWDVYGIWLANNFIDDNGIPSIIYTAHGMKGKIGVLARSADNLISYGEKEPVITNMVHHDGHTWKDGDIWFTITTRQYWGKRPGDMGDAIIILTSPDLKHWTYKGELFSIKKQSNPADDLQKWGFTEFPYLVPFGDKYVLMTGTRPIRYWVGRFDKDRLVFVADNPEGRLLDYLNPFHCFNPLTVDNKGSNGSPRRIIYAMHPGASGQAESLPWNGVHVLPRVLLLDGSRLLQEPVPEVEILRGRHYSRRNIVVMSGKEGLIKDTKGDALEIIAEFAPGDAKQFGLKVRVSDDGKTFTRIFFDAASGCFGIENNIVEPNPYKELGSGLSYIPNGKPVKIHIFLDKCLLEVFVNGHSCTGVFKTDPKFVGLDIFSEAGTAVVSSLDIWEMKSAWLLE